MDKLLTVQEVAAGLHCHPQSVYKNREIPRIKIPGVGIRFKSSDIQKFLDQKTMNPLPTLFLASGNKENSLLFPSDLSMKNSGGISEMPKGKSKTRFNLGYGAIYQRKMKSGNFRWYLDYYDTDQRRIQKVAKYAQTKEEAELALREEVSREFNREYGIKRKREAIKFKDFVELFIENYSKVNKRSWKDDKYRLQKLTCFLGNVYLHDISALDLEKFKSEKIREGLTNTTVNHYLKILKRLFNIAMDWGYAEDNPVKRVKLYSEKDTQKERILTREEEIRLLEVASDHIRPILIVALNSGMRRGEILKLVWNRISLERRQIQVVNTKSGRNRIIPINDVLFEVLNELEKKSEYAFPNPDTGRPYKTIRRSFENACRRAKIKGLRFHDLRHTFASRLVERGVDIVRVKELLGHSSVKVTERYTHSNQDERIRAVELLCDKSLNKDKKVENLLHNCDTTKEKKEYVFISSLFSIN